MTLVAAVVTIAVSASGGITSKRLLARISQHTPMATIVEHGEEMKLADAAARESGAIALWGIGSSMEPIYAPNTAVVVKEVSYSEIKTGMTVVYRKANGRYVAHSVVGEDARGYIVQGINNSEPDSVSVNERNIVGVITAAYSASNGGLHQMLAQAGHREARAVAMR